LRGEIESRAQANVAELSVSAMPGLRFGLVLHMGDVLYGNIGMRRRDLVGAICSAALAQRPV
jgi:hypothetical protein